MSKIETAPEGHLWKATCTRVIAGDEADLKPIRDMGTAGDDWPRDVERDRMAHPGGRVEARSPDGYKWKDGGHYIVADTELEALARMALGLEVEDYTQYGGG